MRGCIIILALCTSVLGFSAASDEAALVTLEDRVSALETSMEACCSTEFRNDAVTEELHYIVKLRRANEELEMRIEVLERFLEGKGEEK